jgi:hypothetical protein
VQGTSPTSTATPTDGTTEGCVASLELPVGGRIKMETLLRR